MDLTVTLPNGVSLPFLQMIALSSKIEEYGRDNCHWHKNECGCCLTVHGPDSAYVIDSDGGETFYPSRGCTCDHDTSGQTK